MPRVRIPQGPVAGVMRVFVSTGGSFHPGLDAVPVCVDLICEGTSHVTPSLGVYLAGIDRDLHCLQHPSVPPQI